MLEVPQVPDRLLERPDLFLPSPEFRDWAFGNFVLDTGSEFTNPDHLHLAQAQIGFLLTSCTQESQGVRTLGTCGLAQLNGKAWQKGQREQQLKGWFGSIPDFLIVLDAVWISTASPLQVCALTEHELYHAAIKKNRWGEVCFDKDDLPIWATRPHDVEEFTGVVKRYGAWKPELEDFKNALTVPPKFGNVSLGGMCGCGKRL